jgi:uncharacterized membrane protein
VRSAAIVLAVTAGLVLAAAPVAQAHDCSSVADCEQTAGYNAVVALVGGLIAIASGLLGIQFSRASRFCERCGSALPAGATVCPSCGHPVPSGQLPGCRSCVGLGLVPVGLVIVVVAFAVLR